MLCAGDSTLKMKDSKLNRQREFFDQRKELQMAKATEEPDERLQKLRDQQNQRGQSLDILGMMSLCPTLVDVTDAPRSSDSLPQPTASTSNILHRRDALGGDDGAQSAPAPPRIFVANGSICDVLKENNATASWRQDASGVLPELETRQNRNQIPCHLKDMKTQWTPGSAAAAAFYNEKTTNVPIDSQSALLREKQQNLANQTKCSAPGLKATEVPLRIKLLNMIDDNTDGDRKIKQKSPSELYAAFPLDGMGTVEKHTPDYVQAREESRHPRPQLQSGPSDLVQNFLLSRKAQAHQGKSVREAPRRPLSNHTSDLQHLQQQLPKKKSSRESLFSVSSLFGASSLGMMNEPQEADPSSPIFIDNGQQVRQEPLFSPVLSTRWNDNPPSFSTERKLLSPTTASPPASVFKQPDFPPSHRSPGFRDTQAPRPFLPRKTYSTPDVFTMCTPEKSAVWYGPLGCNGLPSISTSRKELPTPKKSPSNTFTCLDEVILGEASTPSLDQNVRMDLEYHPIELEPIELDFSSKLNLGMDFSPTDFKGGFSPGLNTEALQFMEKTPDWNVGDVGMTSAAAEEWVIDPPLTWDVTPSEDDHEHPEGTVRRSQLHRPDSWATYETVARDITLDVPEPGILQGFSVESPNIFTSRHQPTQGSMRTKATGKGASSSTLSFFDAYRFQSPSSPTSPLLYDKGRDEKKHTSGRSGRGSGRNVIFQGPIEQESSHEHRQSPRGKGHHLWFEEKEWEKDIFKELKPDLSPVASDPANIIIVCFPANEDVPTLGDVADSLSNKQERGRGQKMDTMEPSEDCEHNKVLLSLGAPAIGFPVNQEFQSPFGNPPDKVESTGDGIALPRPEGSPGCMINPSNKNRTRQMQSLGCSAIGGSAIALHGEELMALWRMQEVQAQSYKPPKASLHSANLTQGTEKNFQDGFQQLSVDHSPSDNKAEQCSSSNMWYPHANHTHNANLVYQEAYMPQEEIVKQVAKVQSTKKDKVGQERGLKSVKLNTDDDRASCSKKAESPSHHHNIQMIVSNLPNRTDSGQDGKILHQVPKGYQNMQLNISVQSKTCQDQEGSNSEANIKQGSGESGQRLVTEVHNSALGGSSPLQKGATRHFQTPTSIPRTLSFDQEIDKARQDRNKQGNKEGKLSFDELEPVRSTAKFQPLTEQPTQETRELMELLKTRTGLQKRKREEDAPRSLFSELRDKMQLPQYFVNSTQFSKGRTLVELHDEVHSSPLRKQKRNKRPADEKHYIHNANQVEEKEIYAGISRASTAKELLPVTALQPLGKQKGAADEKQDNQDANLESEEEHIAEGSKETTALGLHTEMSNQPFSKRKRASSCEDEKHANKVADWRGQSTTCPQKSPINYTLSELKDEYQQSRAVSSKHSAIGTPLMSDRNQTSPPRDRRQSHLYPNRDQVPQGANEKHCDEFALCQHETKLKQFCLQPENKIGIEAIQKERETTDCDSAHKVTNRAPSSAGDENTAKECLPLKSKTTNEDTRGGQKNLTGMSLISDMKEDPHSELGEAKLSHTAHLSHKNSSRPQRDRDQVPQGANEKHCGEVSLPQPGTRLKLSILQPENEKGTEAIQKERETKGCGSAPKVTSTAPISAGNENTAKECSLVKSKTTNEDTRGGRKNLSGMSLTSDMKFGPTSELGKAKLSHAAHSSHKLSLGRPRVEAHEAHCKVTPIYDAAYVAMLESYAVQLKLMNTILQSGTDLRNCTQVDEDDTYL